jgi:two-component system phosphate regulon sensor histidine kinase PhoR
VPLSAPVAVALGILLLLVAWLAWDYVCLRRAVRDYAESLRQGAPGSASSFGRLEAVSAAVRSIAADFERQLAGVTTERNRLSAVLDQMTDGVLIADAEGRVQFCNPAARRILDKPDPLDRSVTEVLRHHQLVEAWQRSRRMGSLQSESVETPMQHQFLHLIAMPDQYAGGSLLLIQDLTRLRRLETVRQDFVSNISHELRTPLASLKALAESLQAGAVSDPEAGPHFLARMIVEVDALTQMAQELLDLSRIESGQVALEMQNVAARKLLQSAADRMKMQAERAGLDLRVECSDDLPRAHADPSRLEQVLVNLIHNAVKFTRPGGEVVLSAQVVTDGEGPDHADRSAGGAIRFSVRDSGTGIPADDVPRIFERFYRVDRSRAGAGTGLGLAIAKHIVEAHGGKIWVESIEGQGSAFSFSIPMA